MLNWRKDKQNDDASGPSAGSRLGDVLMEEGLVSQGQVDDGLKKAGQDGTFLGQALVETGVIQQNDLITCLVKKCKIPHLSLLDYDISDDLVSLLSKEVCQRYHLVPIDKLGRILTVAMVDPLDDEALAVIREACPDLKIKPILCDWNHYRQVTERQFGTEAKPANEVSFESLGLSGKRAKSKASPKNEDQAKQPAQAQEADEDESASVEAAPVHSSAGPGEAGAAGPSTESISQALREVLQESLSAFASEIRAGSPERSAPQSGATLEEVAALLQTSLKDVVQETVQAINQRTKGAISSPADEAPAAVAEAISGFSPGELVNALLQAMEPTTQAMQEAVASMQQAVQRVAGGKAAAGDAPAEDLSESATQIMKAAEAAIEATRAAEALRTARTEDTESERQEKRTRFNTVRAFGKPAQSSDDPDAHVRAALNADCPLEGFSFDRFCVSKSNEFAVKLCHAIAEKPGAEHNPVFLCGPVGVGKTHLINATGNMIFGADTTRRVGYVSAGRFAERLLEAREHQAAEYFREAYSHWDVLILDDLQFLGGQIVAQEEFFHIFNALHQAGRQIILAADKAPEQLGHLEHRLVSRFASGIVAQLMPPDYECRMAILRQFCDLAKVKVPDDTLAVLATKIPHDVRKMTGSLRKVIAFASLVGQDISSDMAYQVLDDSGVAEAAR